MLLPLPVCLLSRFQQCQHVLAPTGALLCCCLIEYAGCCVAAGCEVGGAICQRLKSRQGVRQQNDILLVAVFLNQEFCGSFQGVYFCSVVGAQVTSWDGEGGGGSIWATDASTTASIPNSILCSAICEDMGPGALGIATLYHLQCECFLQFWSLCSLCCKAWNFSSDFWKALPRCPDTHCEFLTFFWICLQKISIFFL